MIRYLKVLFVFLVAFWAFIAFFGNLAPLHATYDSVRSVTVMPMFHGGEGPPWATDNATVIWLGVLLIVSGKFLTMLCTGYGTYAMWRAVKADAASFQRAKQWAILGCGIAVAMLFLGFTIIGEHVFLMFMDPMGMGAAQTAFRYAGLIALMMIFVSQPEYE